MGWRQINSTRSSRAAKICTMGPSSKPWQQNKLKQGTYIKLLSLSTITTHKGEIRMREHSEVMMNRWLALTVSILMFKPTLISSKKMDRAVNKRFQMPKISWLARAIIRWFTMISLASSISFAIPVRLIMKLSRPIKGRRRATHRDTLTHKPTMLAL